MVRAAREPEVLARLRKIIQTMTEMAAEELICAVQEGDEVRVRAALARGGCPKVTVPTRRGMSWCLVALAASEGHDHLLPALMNAVGLCGIDFSTGITDTGFRNSYRYFCKTGI